MLYFFIKCVTIFLILSRLFNSLNARKLISISKRFMHKNINNASYTRMRCYKYRIKENISKITIKMKAAQPVAKVRAFSSPLAKVHITNLKGGRL